MAKKNENGSGTPVPDINQASEQANLPVDATASRDQSPVLPPEGELGDGLIAVSLRHTSPYPKYHRAGLALTSRFQDFTVTKEQLAILEKDTFVEVKKS